MHTSPRRALAVLAILSTAFLSSCTIRSTGQYRVTTGLGVYLHVQGVPSWQLSHDLYKVGCKRSVACTSSVLHRTVKVSGWGAAEFSDGIDHHGKFKAAIEDALVAGYSTGWHSGAKCLVLKKSLSGNLTWSTEWIAPIKFNHDCQVGEKVAG